jgi:hypothetical protein
VFYELTALVQNYRGENRPVMLELLKKYQNECPELRMFLISLDLKSNPCQQHVRIIG